MKSGKMSFMAAALIGTVTAGCGYNNIIYETSKEQIVSEDKIQESYVSCQFSPAPDSNASFSVSLIKHESVASHKQKFRNREVYYTKYKFWKELYEMPLGVLLMPVSLFSHLASAATFNMYPFSTSQKINVAALTGINPFKNWKCWPETVAEEEAKVKAGKMSEADRKTAMEPVRDPKPEDLGRSTQIRTTPLANKDVFLKSGKSSKKYTTDKFGSFKVSYVHPSSFGENFIPQKRKFAVVLSDNGQSKEILRGNTVILRRDFMQNLSIARSRIAAYKARPTGKELYGIIIMLEKMGFIDLAYDLEEQELREHENEQNFINDFNSAMD